MAQQENNNNIDINKYPTLSGIVFRLSEWHRRGVLDATKRFLKYEYTSYLDLYQELEISKKCLQYLKQIYTIAYNDRFESFMFYPGTSQTILMLKERLEDALRELKSSANCEEHCKTLQAIAEVLQVYYDSINDFKEIDKLAHKYKEDKTQEND